MGACAVLTVLTVTLGNGYGPTRYTPYSGPPVQLAARSLSVIGSRYTTTFSLVYPATPPTPSSLSSTTRQTDTEQSAAMASATAESAQPKQEPQPVAVVCVGMAGMPLLFLPLLLSMLTTSQARARRLLCSGSMRIYTRKRSLPT